MLHLTLSPCILVYILTADKLVEADTLPTVLQCFNACPTFGKGEHRLQVCFFSATLHSEGIQSLTKSICQNPTWVDLKGKDAIPESVHHVVYRVDLSKSHTAQDKKQGGGGGGGAGGGGKVGEKRRHEAVTDGVHVGMNASTPIRERQSQQLKEMKQHILLEIVDKFQVSQRVTYVCMCQNNHHHQSRQCHHHHHEPFYIPTLLTFNLLLSTTIYTCMYCEYRCRNASFSVALMWIVTI